MFSHDQQSIFLRDTIKKHHGFLAGRRRKLAYTDARLDELFATLKELVDKRIVERFRVIFGSDLVELRFSDNPVVPVSYRTDEFLDTDFHGPCTPIVNPDHCIPAPQVRELLTSFKELRARRQMFLEAFRLNSIANNIWAYFSSGKSLMGSAENFVAYSQLREEQERVNAEMALLLAFPGDEFESISSIVTRSEDSAADDNADAINEKATLLFEQQKIFEFQLYSGSGLIRVISCEDPHLNIHYTVETFLADTSLFELASLTPAEVLAIGREPQNNTVVGEKLDSLLQTAKRLRQGDQELYLRVFYLDALYDMVVCSFSCGGTYAKTAQEFIESGFGE